MLVGKDVLCHVNECLLVAVLCLSDVATVVLGV